jgi:hypothetical protein
MTGFLRGFPFLKFNLKGDDKGVIVEDGQLSVGTVDKPQETVLGGGDSVPVDMAFHCTLANTTGLTITSAINVSQILNSDTGSTTGLFNGETVGNYLLVGFDYPFGGVKAKYTDGGTIEPANIQADYLQDNIPTWLPASVMATDANNINSTGSQKGWQIGSTVDGNEQWRFGFNPFDLPTTWDKVTLNINGTDYTKYWARFRITSTITSDMTLEQLKIHTNRFEVNADGATEYFGRSRYLRTLQSGIDKLVNNTQSSPANQNVTYQTGTVVANYTDNQFNANALDSALLVQNIEAGLDTSIPLVLSISYYVEGANTGDMQWFADVFHVNDGFIYDGSATPITFVKTEQIITPSNLERRTANILIDVSQLTDADAILINLNRDGRASNPNDTLDAACVVTNVRLSGYFWRP